MQPEGRDQGARRRTNVGGTPTRRCSGDDWARIGLLRARRDTHTSRHQFWRPVIAGKRGRVLVNPDAIHTYHYIPDVAAGLAALGTAADDVYGRPWMLPCAPAETMRALVTRLSRELGRQIELMTVPRTVLKILALAVPFLREIDEMMYQWEESFVVDDRRFRAQFGLGSENVNRAAADTVAWAKAHYVY